MVFKELTLIPHRFSQRQQWTDIRYRNQDENPPNPPVPKLSDIDPDPVRIHIVGRVDQRAVSSSPDCTWGSRSVVQNRCLNAG